MNLLTRIFIISAVLGSIVLLPDAHAGWNSSNKTGHIYKKTQARAQIPINTEATITIQQQARDNFDEDIQSIFSIEDEIERFQIFQNFLLMNARYLSSEQMNVVFDKIFTFNDELLITPLIELYQGEVHHDITTVSHVIDTLLMEENYNKLSSADVFTLKNSAGSDYLDPGLKEALNKKGVTQLAHRDLLLQGYMETMELDFLPTVADRSEFKNAVFNRWNKLQTDEAQKGELKKFIDAYESLDASFKINSPKANKNAEVPNE